MPVVVRIGAICVLTRAGLLSGVRPVPVAYGVQLTSARVAIRSVAGCFFYGAFAAKVLAGLGVVVLQRVPAATFSRSPPSPVSRPGLLSA